MAEKTFFPIIVDGPMRGQRCEVSVSSNHFQVIGSMPSIDPLKISRPSYPATNLSEFTYHLHKFYLLGRVIMIASIHALMPYDDRTADFLWLQLITKRGAEAVR